MPKQLDFSDKYNKVIKALERENAIVICTSNRDKVAARTVWYFYHNDCIYFITSKAYAKYKQINKNPNVALCLYNIQIEGVAFIKGHPLIEENKSILEYSLVKHPEMNRYNHQKNTVFIEVRMENISVWHDGGREYINLKDKTAYRIG